MKALLAILLFFALAQPAAACRRFSIWHYDFPPTLPDRSRGGPSRACAGHPPARLERDHLGRNRRRAANRDREASGPEQRPLTLVSGFHRQGTFSFDRCEVERQDPQREK